MTWSRTPPREFRGTTWSAGSVIPGDPGPPARRGCGRRAPPSRCGRRRPAASLRGLGRVRSAHGTRIPGWNVARGLIPFRFTREALITLEDLAGGFAVGTEET